ncbi:MAG: FtsW/RodA/SpoVE family cell cycle protein [Segniliparus sp.]|uniref:FtsW/RodA/SpoVE family cell cycle protein n=1 Tax=Segniliparus sp. TaxID=2804064 RepID=UPI003F411658
MSMSGTAVRPEAVESKNAAQRKNAAPPATGSHAAPRSRRNIELLLIVVAVVVVLAALALVDMNLHRPVLGDLVRIALVYGVMMGGAHLVIRFFAPYADPLLFPVVALLNGIGLILIFRIGVEVRDPGSEAVRQSILSFDTNPQLAWTFVSVVAFSLVLVFLKDYRVLSRYGYTLGALGVLFLAIPIFTAPVNGSNVWIHLGFLTIQPGEFAKIALIVCSASLLVAKRELFVTAGKRVLGMDLPRMRDLGPLLLAWGLAIATLFLQNDLGMGLLIFLTALIMLYIATERLGWLLIGLLMLVAAGAFAFTSIPHVETRAQAWWDPLADCDNKGYQLCEALFGLAVGGLGGTGLGAGSPARIPEAHNDFILAAAGEELGLIGLAAIVLLYYLLVDRGVRVALTVRDSFGKLLAAGLAITVALQVFIIAGGVTDLIPLTGLTTPFMSSGGSSLLSNYILLALLLKISHEARKPGSLPVAAPASGKAKTTKHSAAKASAPQPAPDQDVTTAHLPKVPAEHESSGETSDQGTSDQRTSDQRTSDQKISGEQAR